MRLFAVACSALVACNALTGVSDLAIGEEGGAPLPGTEAGATDAAEDVVTVSTPDATVADVTTEADAKKDVTADAGPPRPDGGRFVFATTATTQGNLSGLAGADFLCNQSASVAGLGGTWVAWLSTTTVDALSRLTAAGPWYLVTGTLVSDKAGLQADNLAHSIDRTELGMLPPDDERAWTGTRNGAYFNVSCQNWTSSTTATSGNAGSTKLMGAGWTATGAPNCGTALHVYCFEN